MQLTINNKQDFLNFLLNTEELNNWDVVKFEASNNYRNIKTNPIYYEYNKPKFIKLGDRNFNLFAHLQQTDTMDDYAKTMSQYNAVLNYVQTGTFKQRMYPKEILQRFIDNTTDRFSLDIKLSYPQELKSIFDYDNHFENFYADFYCTTSTQGVIFTYTEKIKDFNLEPPKEWLSYCYDLYMKSIGLNKKA